MKELTANAPIDDPLNSPVCKQPYRQETPDVRRYRMPRNFEAELEAYRRRAANMRADAEKVKDGELKRQMLKLAESFDGLIEATEALRESGYEPF